MSATRTADQTLACKFWAASTVSYLWDRVAVTLGAQRGLSLSQNAHLLALLNIAMADAAIACWDAKYTYLFWRPVTAIPSLSDDGQVTGRNIASYVLGNARGQMDGSGQ